MIPQYKQYLAMLKKWGEKIDLVSAGDMALLEQKHFVDCRYSLSLIDSSCHSLIDLGTGAGLPGIIIKIERQNIKVVLLDSRRKRVSFCNQVILQLGLKDTVAVLGRAEDSKVISKFGKFDIAISRATWQLKDYLPIAVNYSDNIIAMKGPSFEEELLAAGTILNDLGLNIDKKIEYELDKGERRVVVRFKKCL